MTATRYGDIARRTLDVLHEFGECRVIHVGNVAELRAEIRREGRRRRQRLKTQVLPGPEPDQLFVWTEDPSVEASAYQAVAESLIPEAIDRAMRPDRPSEPLMDGAVRMVDAEWI